MLTWHGLAKLRMHTELTLRLLRTATIRLGRELRSFQKNVCPHYATKETAKEAETRARSQARRGDRTQATPATQDAPIIPETATGTQAPKQTGPAAPGTRRPYTFKLTKPKLHFLGDYPDEIELCGPTDNYSTQPVSEFPARFR